MSYLRNVVFLLFLGACTGDEKSNEWAANFDHMAANSLIKIASPSQLTKQDSSELCRFIADDLDRLGSKISHSVHVVYPYYLKNYYLDQINLEVALIRDQNDSVHLIAQDVIRDWMFDFHHRYDLINVNDGQQILQLHDSIPVIHLLNNSYDFIINDSIFERSPAGNLESDYVKARKLAELMKLILKSQYDQVCGLGEFNEYMSSNQSYLTRECQTWASELNRDVQNYAVFEIYHVLNIGFLSIGIPKNRNEIIDVTFVPLRIRHRVQVI